MKLVLVVGNDHLVKKMFSSAGWAAFGDAETYFGIPNLICFTGGADVSPHMYGEENISSHCDPIRDEYEREVYEQYVGKVPLVGICRGGQFLNVMNGGKMLQDIRGHHMGKRKINMFDTLNVRVIHEDHHQGMVPKDTMHGDPIVLGVDATDGNYEILLYEKTRALCFQPHPEWGHSETKDLFFELLDEYIFPAPIDALAGPMGIVK